MIVISVTKKRHLLNALRISLSLGRKETHLSEVNPPSGVFTDNSGL